MNLSARILLPPESGTSFIDCQSVALLFLAIISAQKSIILETFSECVLIGSPRYQIS